MTNQLGELRFFFFAVTRFVDTRSGLDNRRPLDCNQESNSLISKSQAVAEKYGAAGCHSLTFIKVTDNKIVSCKQTIVRYT